MSELVSRLETRQELEKAGITIEGGRCPCCGCFCKECTHISEGQCCHPHCNAGAISDSTLEDILEDILEAYVGARGKSR